MAASFLQRAKDLIGLPGAKPDAKPDVRKPATVFPKQAATSHHAVSVAPGPRCCTAAREIKGKRFLSREAPPLPLKGCDSSNCACRYVHYGDRRSGPRRARELGVSIDGWVEEDRRLPKRGRRKTDEKR